MARRHLYASSAELGGLVVVPVPSTLVSGGESARITTRSFCVVRPIYLVVPRSIAPYFRVQDVRVGKNSQFRGDGEVPAEIFAGDFDSSRLGESPPRPVEVDHPIPLELDVLAPDQDLAIWVHNVHHGAVNFEAAVFGQEVC